MNDLYVKLMYFKSKVKQEMNIQTKKLCIC